MKAVGLVRDEFGSLGMKSALRAFQGVVAEENAVSMLGMSSQFEILNPVIILNAILVMDEFATEKRAAQMFCHDKTMLLYCEVIA